MPDIVTLSSTEPIPWISINRPGFHHQGVRLCERSHTFPHFAGRLRGFGVIHPQTAEKIILYGDNAIEAALSSDPTEQNRTLESSARLWPICSSKTAQ